MAVGTSAPAPSTLGESARASLLWGGGFTLLRDLAQFGVMLILVRLLNPADYGTAAVVQAILGVVTIVSFNTFSGHALQVRDPGAIDWQAHFTAAAVLNTLLAGLMLALAFGLSLTQRYGNAAAPLAALAAVFMIEIPATLRHRMLEANHHWRRFRILVMIGTLLGLAAGLAVALAGGGVWALVAQIPMLGLPGAIDLFFGVGFKPDWTWRWARYRDTARFGLDRIGSGLVVRGRMLNDQILLSSLYDLATLGIFTRATGLSTLLAGRIGSVVMAALYPIVTRAPRRSARFRRLASLVLRGVVWTTLPAIAFLALAAQDIVQLLYGAQWGRVVPFLPLAAATMGLGGITSTLSSLLVANEDSRAALSLDVVAATTGIAVAVALVPFGVSNYLAGLGAHALATTCVATALLRRREGISGNGIAAAFVPAIVAALAGTAGVITVRHGSGVSEHLAVRLLADALVFGGAYLGTLRALFVTPLAELLEISPGGKLFGQMLVLIK